MNNIPDPRRRRRIVRVARSPVTWTIWVGSLAGIFLLALAGAALAVSIAAYIRDNNHHDRTHAHIKSRGFSVYKNTTQDLMDNTTTVLSDWIEPMDADWPAYDRSHGFFNASSGIYTVRKPGIYMAVGSVCFIATNNGTRAARLITNGQAAAIVFNRADASGALVEQQCLGLHQIMNLNRDAAVWLEAFSDSGTDEFIGPGSRFGVERIAIF